MQVCSFSDPLREERRGRSGLGQVREKRVEGAAWGRRGLPVAGGLLPSLPHAVSGRAASPVLALAHQPPPCPPHRTLAGLQALLHIPSSFIHSFSRHFLKTCFVPHTVLSVGSRDKTLAPVQLLFFLGSVRLHTTVRAGL